MYTSEQRAPRAFTAESPQAAAHNKQENEERPPRGPKNNEVDRDVQKKKMPRIAKGQLEVGRAGGP